MRRSALALLLLLVAPAGVRGQEPPPPPDSVRPEAGDTLRRERQDTVRPDSLVPAPLLPAYPQPDSAEFWSGTWTWDREELLRFQGTSLLELLVRVPGVVVTRAGGFGQPAGIAPFGLGGGRTRIFLDGWELDPLSSATFDLQQISLVDLEVVRVERRLNELRVHLTPFRLSDRRPFSQIEAATGDPEVRFLRGLYAQPLWGRSVLTLGFDLTDTRGFRRGESFGVTTGFARWSYLFTPRLGAQVEYRQVEVERPEPFLEQATRAELFVRGRWTPSPRLFLEGIAGRVRRDPEGEDPFEEVRVDQFVLRSLLLPGGGSWLEGAARLRRDGEGGFPVPQTDLALRGGVRPAPVLAVEAEARAIRTGEESGTELRGTVRVGPMRGLSLFGSAATGSHGVGVLRGDTVVGEPFRFPEVVRADTFRVFGVVPSRLDGLRAGVEWSRPGAVAGAALLRLAPERVAPFGLPFEPDTLPVAEVEASTGAEAYLSLPVYPGLRLDGWYNLWTETGGRPYLPEEEGRLALEYHRVFYTGNLEPTVRLEVLRRGQALVPAGVVRRLDPRADPGSGAVATDPYTLANFFLQLRIIDVRAFVWVENLFNVRTAADLPGRRLPPARVLYGVKWFFRN